MVASTAAFSVCQLPVRRLTAADMPAIIELAADRGWPVDHGKWRLLFAVSEPYGVDDPAGGLAGLVVLTRYGSELAAIGMMLVATRHGRQGLGRRLMRHAIALAGDAVVHLTATSLGRPLYEQLGFRAVDSSVTYLGTLAGSPAGGTDETIRRVTADDLPAIAALDAAVYGADRSQVLSELVTFAERFDVLGRPAAGYAAAWNNDGTRVIGPVVATDERAAAALITSVARDWTGPVRLDIRGRDAGLAGWAGARGLAKDDETALMVLGGDLPGDRARLWCPVTVAIG